MTIRYIGGGATVEFSTASEAAEFFKLCNLKAASLIEEAPPVDNRSLEEILKSFQMEEKPSKRGRPRKYPLDTLEIGQHFAVASDAASVQRVRSAVYNFTQTAEGANKSFGVRRQGDAYICIRKG